MGKEGEIINKMLNADSDIILKIIISMLRIVNSRIDLGYNNLMVNKSLYS